MKLNSNVEECNIAVLDTIFPALFLFKFPKIVFKNMILMLSNVVLPSIYICPSTKNLNLTYHYIDIGEIPNFFNDSVQAPICPRHMHKFYNNNNKIKNLYILNRFLSLCYDYKIHHINTSLP